VSTCRFCLHSRFCFNQDRDANAAERRHWPSTGEVAELTKRIQITFMNANFIFIHNIVLNHAQRRNHKFIIVADPKLIIADDTNEHI